MGEACDAHVLRGGMAGPGLSAMTGSGAGQSPARAAEATLAERFVLRLLLGHRTEDLCCLDPQAVGEDLGYRGQIGINRSERVGINVGKSAEH